MNYYHLFIYDYTFGKYPVCSILGMLKLITMLIILLPHVLLMGSSLLFDPYTVKQDLNTLFSLPTGHSRKHRIGRRKKSLGRTGVMVTVDSRRI